MRRRRRREARVVGVRRTSRDVVLTADTPQPAPRWALLERQLLEAQARACEGFFARYFDERGYLLCVPALVRRRRPGRRAREPAELDGAARAGRRRPRPGALQAGAGRPLPAVHRGEDDRGRARPGRDVLPGVPRLLRLVPPRRGLVHHLPAGAVRPRRRGAGPPDAPLDELVHGRRPVHPQLRQAAQGHPRASSTAAAGRCCARRRRSTGPATRSRSRGASTPATARRPSRRCSTTSATTPTWSATTTSTSARPRSALTAYALTGEQRVPRLGARVPRRLGRADRAERRPDPDQRRARTGRSRAATAGTAASTAGASRCCRCRATASSPTAPTTAHAVLARQRAAADRRPRATSTCGAG